MTTETTIVPQANDDPDYHAFLARVQARFLDNVSRPQPAVQPLFKTDAGDLFAAYLTALPAEHRQHNTCSACRRFVNTFGGLVAISESGSAKSVMWNEEDAPALYVPSVRAMLAAIRGAKVTSVFLSSESVWGTPETGPWRHLAAQPPASAVYIARHDARGKLITAGQAAAEKRADFGTMGRALAELPLPAVETAIKLLKTDSLYRSEKCLGVAEWLRELHVARDAAKRPDVRDNLLWRAVATAPAGFCHPRSSMIGTLLEDIIDGLAFDDISRRFADKMAPMRYQRAQVAPRAGQIEAAEKAVQALGIAPAFARRYAVASDFDAPGAVLWRAGEVPAIPAAAANKTAAGVFDHLKPAAAASADPDVAIPPRLMTWEKFQRDVLPGAALIQYRVPMIGRFCALTAAQDLAAPPILQWDEPEQRNTVSWCFPHPAARADEWGLVPGALVPVRVIANSPNLWNGAGDRFKAHGRGVFLLLEGASDKRGVAGGGLFPEHLRSELKPYRSTIEAHLNQLTVAGVDDPATAGFGIGLLAGHDWSEAAAPPAPTIGGGGTAPERIHVILLVDDSGSMSHYIDAAQRALRFLLTSVRAMPGNVDVSVTLFGTRKTILANRQTLASIEGVERNMSGQSGGTALNDAIVETIEQALTWPDAHLANTSFLFGLVTDGEEIDSHRPMSAAAEIVRRVNATGRWTVTYAGAGRNPRAYAREIGIPEGNITAFEASARGFEAVGAVYAASTRSMAGAYASGARSSTSFFAAASGTEKIGTDHPVLLVTSKSGMQAAYKIDRWD